MLRASDLENSHNGWYEMDIEGQAYGRCNIKNRQFCGQNLVHYLICLRYFLFKCRSKISLHWWCYWYKVSAYLSIYLNPEDGSRNQITLYKELLDTWISNKNCRNIWVIFVFTSFLYIYLMTIYILRMISNFSYSIEVSRLK